MKRSSRAPARSVTPKVLIVDDSPAARNFLKALLNVEAIEFAEAWDGEAAYRIARQSKLDLMILDMNMPKLDGIGLLRLLRADPDPNVRSLPVVLFSGDRSADLQRRAIDAGATAFLSKPVSPDGVDLVLELLRKPRSVRPRARSIKPDPASRTTVPPPRR